MIRIYFLILPLFLFFSCNGQTSADTPGRKISIESDLDYPIDMGPSTFNRDSISAALKKKIKNKIPLVVHVFVPLCDNKHQGIVPVNASLGNGMNLTTNLYWGAAYGVKSYFKKSADWKFLKSEMKIDSNVLERIVFVKNFPNGAKVYLVADAYRGDKMKECMEEYFNSIAGIRKDSIIIADKKIVIAAAADLVVLNGHNGLMDMNIQQVTDIDQRKKDAAVIACMSHNYFKQYLLYSGAYPLLTTTNFMAPEAYVLEALLNSWAILISPAETRINAGAAYHKYQKCGLSGATKLFKTGW